MKFNIRRYQLLLWLCMVGYIIFILYVTLFSRACKETFQYNFLPFWSYSAILDGSDVLISEIFLNVLLFMPLGALLWCEKKLKKWWKSLTIGCLLSLCIEVAQLILKRGFCELDDVIHNSLGTIIGFWLAASIATIVNKLICSR